MEKKLIGFHFISSINAILSPLLDYKGEVQQIHKNKTIEDYIDLAYQILVNIKRFRTCSSQLLKRYKWADFFKRKLLGDII